MGPTEQVLSLPELPEHTTGQLPTVVDTFDCSLIVNGAITQHSGKQFGFIFQVLPPDGAVTQFNGAFLRADSTNSRATTSRGERMS